MAGVVLPTLAAGVMWSSSLAVALDPGAPVAAGVEKFGVCEGAPAAMPPGPNRGDEAARAPVRLAQFQLPPRSPAPTTPPDTQPGATPGTDPGATQPDVSPRYPYRPLIQHLKYEYAIGTESPIDYRRNSDLNSNVQDNVLIVTPQVNGIIVYRPTDWLVGTLEMILEREYVAQAPAVITLPGGEQIFPKNQPTSFLVDQGFVTVRRVTDPFELHAGRRNYEDERHWLYDTSLDMGSIELKTGTFRAEATGGRQALWDLDFGTNAVKDRIDTYMLYAEYRGIEDTKLAAYAIRRHDRSREEGRPLNLGVRALGRPTDHFRYWIDLALLRGHDENSRQYRGRGFDIGGTYTVQGLPLYPSFTLSYAYGSGDKDPSGSVNKEFRQTGLESNEEKWAGLAKFKYYGEALDPQLSNLKIMTVGFGFRPARTVTVDLVYHWYRLDAIAETLRAPITAVMNQDDARQSKDVGEGFDVVIGWRNVFGIRRLGIDLRMGWFYPGDAYRIEQGDPNNPTFQPANNGVGVVAKFWY